MKSNIDDLRQKCKYLKWNKDIKYYEMAKSIGITEHAFYNFINNKKINLGYTTLKRLENYLEEMKNDSK